jgi:hypothetical protein
MQQEKKLALLSIIFGTIGLILFLLQKVNIIQNKIVNYIGKGFIVIGIYLLAITLLVK